MNCFLHCFLFIFLDQFFVHLYHRLQPEQFAGIRLCYSPDALENCFPWQGGMNSVTSGLRHLTPPYQRHVNEMYGRTSVCHSPSSTHNSSATTLRKRLSYPWSNVTHNPSWSIAMSFRRPYPEQLALFAPGNEISFTFCYRFQKS